MLPATSQAQESKLGTLFTSPEEREYLDYLRKDFVTRSELATFNIQEDVIPDIPVTEEEPGNAEPEIIEYRFGGVMTRINGNRIAWLNDKQTAESDLPSTMRLVNSESGTTLLNIRANGRAYQLKPGQIINLETGSINESSQNPDSSAETGDTSVINSPGMDEGRNTVETASDQGTPATVSNLTTEQNSAIQDILDDANGESEDEKIGRVLDLLIQQKASAER